MGLDLGLTIFIDDYTSWNLTKVVCLDKRGVHLITLTELCAVIEVPGSRRGPVGVGGVVIIAEAHWGGRVTSESLQAVDLKPLGLSGNSLTHFTISLCHS